MQVWRQHLDLQLDGLTGKIVCANLRVLPGFHNRLEGGTALLTDASCRVLF